MNRIHLVLSILMIVRLTAETGTLVVIQPRLTEQDYRTDVTFRTALETYFLKAEEKRDSLKTQLLVFPEYLGTWTVATNEPDWVFKAGSLNGAMVRLILSHPFRFLKTLFHGLFKDPFETSFRGHIQRAVFIMSADKMKTIYETTFSDLADQYNTWVVAGSILLPELEIQAGKLVYMDSPEGGHHSLMNQSVVFNSEGQPVLVSKKIFPVQEELAFLNSGTTSDLAVATTPLGRLGVLVCADSWYPECYQALGKKNVEIVAVPSFVDPADRWERAWKGYDPADLIPSDVNPEDTKGIYPEKDMWLKYALCGRIGQSKAEIGANSFLIGSFWGLTGGGQSNIVVQGEIRHIALDYLAKDLLVYKRGQP
jgi:predicted amidohydrolase